MSWTPASEPECAALPSAEVELVINGRRRDLGGFSVQRVLPSPLRKLVGPFIFFDHMGPAALPPGQGLDVRPHPHIHLATVTYLFEGEIVHRDSLGSLQAIRPGAVNWMTAGRGIVHSERTSPELRRTGSRAHGIQLWVALPRAHEEAEPAFHHHPAESLPEWRDGGARIRLLAGSAFGRSSPVQTFSPLFYAEARLDLGAALELPAEHEERAAYVVAGALRCGAQRFGPSQMLVFAGGVRPVLRAEEPAHVMLIGGAPLDGPRHIFWNFVSSSAQRIEQAKQDWKHGRFPAVPGDEVVFIPLPE
jgi:redox-sensitive bicupin YhaK (pirin superfamily)